MFLLHIHALLSLRIHLIRSWVLLPGLPLPRPSHQFLPVLASVLGAEACNATNFRVFDLDRDIRLTHQTVPDQVYAVSDMRWTVHHRNILITDCLAGSCR